MTQAANDDTSVYQRILTMLTTALGREAKYYLEDDEVIEIFLNEDGKLWIEKLGEGRQFTKHFIKPEDAERVIYIVASSIKTVCNKTNPIISAELPGTGARFQGLLPPVVKSPIFNIRKKALKIFTLDDYVAHGVLSESHRDEITKAVISRKNILIAGGTGSGKTTLANAVLQEISKTENRLVVIEDTLELQCSSTDFVSLRTKDGLVSMTDLLKATMRLRPDRIIIGEVRGGEALALLKAWNTGHPGGCATIHADSGKRALARLEQLIQEANVLPARDFIADAINIIVFIEKTASSRMVSEVLKVEYGDNDYNLISL